MKKPIATGILALASCQAIVGIEDKQLDPKYASGGSGGVLEAGDVVDASGPTGLDARPPPRPAGPAVPSGSGATRWFAARTIFLGTVDPKDKQKNTSAWKRIGHDIDGECTTAEISNSDTSSTCKKPDNAAADSLADGENCRDSASGRLLSLASQYLSQDFELKLQANLNTADTATYLLKLEDLDNGSDDTYVPGVLYVTVPRDPSSTPPVWNGSDIFNVDVRSVNLGIDSGTVDAGKDAASDAKVEGGGAVDAAIDGPKDAPSEATSGPSPLLDQPRYVFPKGYVKNNVWVSGDFGKSPMELPLFVLDRITVADAETVTLVVELTATHDKAVSSMLSAVASTESLQTQFQPVSLEITDCNPLYATLLMNNFVLPARDLGTEAPKFQSPTQKCAGFSMGFGFEWMPVQPPNYVLPSTEPPPKCAGDAGT